MRRGWIVPMAATLLVFSSGLAAASPAQGSATHGVSDIGHARFEGRWIELSQGWSQATACMVVAGRPTECFRTVGAMETHAAVVLASASPLLNCSTPLKLRDGPNQTLGQANVYSRGIWVNLSSLSFDNKTSSFTVGACSIDLAAGINGGSSHYLSCLSPFCVEDTMDPGWDNAVSSAYLN
jgi:hypothetical protein